jgi:hypothetical protein
MPWLYFTFGRINKLCVLIPNYFNVIICIDGYSEFYKIKNKWYRTNSKYSKILTFENYVKKYCVFIKGFEYPVYNYEKYNIV